MTEPLHIIGGGMAGSEAAWAAANLGVPVVLHEMRPKTGTFAHRTGDFAEMVCSNSFRSDDDERNAVGLIHWEMRAAGSLVMEMAQKHRLPAGGALAVDRENHLWAATETDIVRDSIANIQAKTGRSAAEAQAELVKHNPQGRLVQPAEVANAVLWLCQPGSEAITGQAISVSGGETN